MDKEYFFSWGQYIISSSSEKILTKDSLVPGIEATTSQEPTTARLSTYVAAATGKVAVSGSLRDVMRVYGDAPSHPPAETVDAEAVKL